VTDRDLDGVEGTTIETVRWMTDDEFDAEGWTRRHDAQPVALELSNGQVIYPAADGEGNGGGALFGYADRDGEVVPFTVVPRRERGE